MKLFIYIALTALASSVVSQVLKTFFNIVVRKGKFRLANLVADGNYPSSHTSFVTSVTAISWGDTIYNFVNYGFNEQKLWCSSILSFLWIVVVRDALGVRYTVQKLCEALTKFAKESNREEEVKELIGLKSGHKPHEVVAGAALGLIVASITSAIYYEKYKYLLYALMAFVAYVIISLIIVRKKAKNTV